MADHIDHLADPGPLIPAGRHHAFLAEARELLRLAVPMAATQLAQKPAKRTNLFCMGTTLQPPLNPARTLDEDCFDYNRR